jgi:hypothetical protein
MPRGAEVIPLLVAVATFVVKLRLQLQGNASYFGRLRETLPGHFTTRAHYVEKSCTLYLDAAVLCTPPGPLKKRLASRPRP